LYPGAGVEMCDPKWNGYFGGLWKRAVDEPRQGQPTTRPLPYPNRQYRYRG
jgi:hypothetical protein